MFEQEKPDSSEPEKTENRFFHDLNNHHVLEGFELSKEAKPQGMTANLNEYLEAVRSLKEDLLKPEQRKIIQAQADELRIKLLAEVSEEDLRVILREQQRLMNLERKSRNK